jgi:beta-glucosidase
LTLSSAETDGSAPISVSVTVKNSGAVAGDEVVQLYLTNRNADIAVPTRRLARFRRLSLSPGESTKLTFELTKSDLSYVGENGASVFAAGTVAISVGGHQGDERSTSLTGNPVLSTEVTLVGNG